MKTIQKNTANNTGSRDDSPVLKNGFLGVIYFYNIVFLLMSLTVTEIPLKA